MKSLLHILYISEDQQLFYRNEKMKSFLCFVVVCFCEIVNSRSVNQRLSNDIRRSLDLIKKDLELLENEIKTSSKSSTRASTTTPTRSTTFNQPPYPTGTTKHPSYPHYRHNNDHLYKQLYRGRQQRDTTRQPTLTKLQPTTPHPTTTKLQPTTPHPTTTELQPTTRQHKHESTLDEKTTNNPEKQNPSNDDSSEVPFVFDIPENLCENW